MAKDGLIIINGLNTVFEASVDGGSNWFTIPFTGGVEATGGESPTAEAVDFNRVGSVIGHPRLPAVSVSIAAYVPHHSSWVQIAEKTKAGNDISFRFTTKERKVADSGAATLMIPAGTGGTDDVPAESEGTLAPTPTALAPHPVDWASPKLGPASVVKVGTGTAAKLYVVDSIVDKTSGAYTYAAPKFKAIRNGDLLGFPQITLVAATAYTVIKPSLRRNFEARLTAPDPFNLPAEDALTNTLALQLTSDFTLWAMHKAA